MMGRHQAAQKSELDEMDLEPSESIARMLVKGYSE